VDWCKNPLTSRHLPFDFVLRDKKIIIELDGPQHFFQVSNWISPDEQFERDRYKERCANENGYFVIRLLQEDVWSDRYDWMMELRDIIQQTTFAP
jgi:very-short-patch-repair endonuclease